MDENNSFGKLVLGAILVFAATVAAMVVAPMISKRLHSDEAPASSQADLRIWTWTDPERDLAFDVEAEFMNMQFGEVALKKRSGEIVKLQMDELSTTDQEWIKERARSRRRRTPAGPARK